MYFKKKRGIIPDGLVQMKLSNFRKTFPNLNTEENAKNAKLSSYTNINVGESGRKVSTNGVRAATSKDLQSTNGRGGLMESMKRKVEPLVRNSKKRRENSDFA
jgi:hypothetical protein